MTDGADLMPWAVDMLLEWHEDDPVSQKEIERNGTIYGIQGNRNPFVDRPEFAEAMFATTGVDELGGSVFALHQNAPNPFNPTTSISFSLSVESEVELSIYDVAGRLVTTLAEGEFPAGSSAVSWDGRDGGGRDVGSGVYFYRLSVQGDAETGKMVILR
jgi:hypothetical protein